MANLWSLGQQLGSAQFSSGATTQLVIPVTSNSHRPGDPLFVFVGWSANTRTITSITDTVANTYAVEHTKNSPNKCNAIWGSAGNNALTAPASVLVNFSAGTNNCIGCVASFHGGALTEDSEGDSNSAAGTFAPSGLFVLLGANELCIASVTQIASAVGDLSVPTNWTNLYDLKHSTAQLTLAVAYSTSLPAGTSTYAPTTASSWSWNICTDSFLPYPEQSTLGGLGAGPC